MEQAEEMGHRSHRYRSGYYEWAVEVKVVEEEAVEEEAVEVEAEVLEVGLSGSTRCVKLPLLTAEERWWRISQLV